MLLLLEKPSGKGLDWIKIGTNSECLRRRHYIFWNYSGMEIFCLGWSILSFKYSLIYRVSFKWIENATFKCPTPFHYLSIVSYFNKE